MIKKLLVLLLAAMSFSSIRVVESQKGNLLAISIYEPYEDDDDDDDFFPSDIHGGGTEAIKIMA